jgi:hypothetical protein|tara:strand:+ start:3397 stop:3774 length:378 start_codon:yes stop_codon:yes gene_type:complete
MGAFVRALNHDIASSAFIFSIWFFARARACDFGVVCVTSNKESFLFNKERRNLGKELIGHDAFQSIFLKKDPDEIIESGPHTQHRYYGLSFSFSPEEDSLALCFGVKKSTRAQKRVRSSRFHHRC